MTADAVELPVIRRSFRCFWYGVAGLIPGVGVALAWQAIGLFRSIAKAGGEQTDSHFPAALFLTAFLVNPILIVSMDWTVGVANTLFPRRRMLSGVAGAFKKTNRQNGIRREDGLGAAGSSGRLDWPGPFWLRRARMFCRSAACSSELNERAHDFAS
jgi:hypothetical protein